MNRIIMVFGAKWCPPCKNLKKNILPELNPAQVVYVDVDDQPEIATKVKIEKLPTVIYYETGEEKKRKIGMIDPEKTRNWLEEWSDDID